MDLQRFRRFLKAFQGGPNPGLTWASIADWAERDPDRFAAAVASLEAARLGEFDLSGPLSQIRLEPPPPGSDYEKWTEKRRRRANLNALAALRQFQGSEQPAPTPAERHAMEAYTGWGGFTDIHALPPDGRLFPPIYLQGIEAWRKAQERQTVPMGPGADLFRGLRQQYFTSLAVAEGMWRLGCRAAPFLVHDVLETSAGVGRFLRVAQESGVRWTAVEMDALLAEFLRALYPTADVQESPFEAFAAAASKAMRPGAGWDMVIGNPPYPDRPNKDRATDPAFAGWVGADAYFAVRGLSLLRPGGVLVYLTPASNIIGKSDENIGLRKGLLQRAHFAGAAFPPASIFPNISIQLAVHVWVRRAEDAREFTPQELQVLGGGYLETPEGQTNTLGVWKTRKGPHGRDVDYVDGAFSPSAMDYVQLYPLPHEALESLRRARGETQAERPKLPSRKPERAVVSAEVLPEVVVQARLLSGRLVEFFRRLGSGGADAAMAEAGREELKTDLRAFYTDHGAPSGIREIRADRKRFAPLLAAIDDLGVLSGDVETVRGSAVADAPPAGSAPRTVVEFYSRRNGMCSDVDLGSYFDHDVSPQLLADSGIAVEFRPDGYRWWYRNEDYVTGDLYARLALVDSQLETADDPELRTKLEDQKALLLANMGERELVDIDVTPRSGFVPPECLTAWVVDTIFVNQMQRATVASRRDRRDREKDFWRGQPTAVKRLPIVAYVETARLRLQGVPENLDEGDLHWLAFVTAFWNRSLQVEDPRGGGGSRMDAFKRDQSTPEERMIAEEQLVTQFKAWLGGNADWGPRIRQAYNHAYSGQRPRVYDHGPLSIARLGPHPRGYELQAHQNASVRRLDDRGSGVVALDVGLGKTLTLLASIALARQNGRCRRPLVVVPNSVLGKWWAEASAWLPTYRIGVIGLTLGKRGVRSDTPEERAEKWQKFAQGAYDLGICTQTNFLDDVALSDERTAELVGQMFWLQRDLGLSAEEKRLVEGKITEAKRKIDGNLNKIDEFEKELRVWGENRLPHRWARMDLVRYEGLAAEVRQKLVDLQKQVEVQNASIARWEEQLATPTSTEIEKAREVAEGFVTDKPFRPSKDRPLVDWISLGVDYLGVDEAHAYKNIWKPANRYGKTIKYMGGMEQKAKKGGGRRGGEEEEGSDEEDDFGKTKGKRTVRAWDMYLKTQDMLDRNGDRGVVLLTATPVTNSPVEIYNLVSLTSRRVWQTRQVRNKEEFVDRYCKFEEQLIADGITGGVRYQLAMSEFVALDELRGILNTYVEYRTTQDVLAWQERMGVPVERRLRVPEDAPQQETIPVDPVQATIYAQLREHIIAEQVRLREAKAPPKEISALNLVLSDLLSKAALDPRLLAEDIEAIARAIPKEKDPVAAKRLERRSAILAASGAGEAAVQYQRSGAVPEKYLALARNIAARPSAGHIVFVDYKLAFPEIIRVLTTYAGIPRERIVTLTGEDDKADRTAIANGALIRNADGSIKSNTGGYNGRDPVVRGEGTPEEVVIDPGAEPQYDVIIGTSGAMSEGIDLQRRTAAVHHLNYSWVPSVLQQRNGRAVRQGNRFGTVQVWYYLSERTVDVVRLSVTWGKANWLASLFGEAQSIANPAAAIGSDVEEAIAEMFAPDPEAARVQLATLRAQREAERLNQQRAKAQARFVSLVAQYEQFRRIKDPVTQAAKMASADHVAESLRALPRSVFGRPNLLVQARKEPVFYDLATGVHFMHGSRFALRLTGVTPEPLQVDVEVLDFRSTVGQSSLVYSVDYRVRGGIVPETATNLRQLLQSAMPRARDGSKVPVPTEGGTLEQLPAAWDTAEEVAGIKSVSTRHLVHVPKGLLPYGAQLWRKAKWHDWNTSHSFYVLVRPATAPGQLWLLSGETINALRHTDHAALQGSLLPLYGSDDASWRYVCDAIRSGRVQTFYLLNKNYGDEKNPHWEQTMRPFAYGGRYERESLKRAVFDWYRRELPEALLAEGEKRQVSAAGASPVTGVSF